MFEQLQELQYYCIALYTHVVQYAKYNITVPASRV